jgi:uncharacterized protein (UPF0147 family)
MKQDSKLQAPQNLQPSADNKARQLKASLRSHAAQFDSETKRILGSVNSLKDALNAIKHTPLEFGARAALAVLQEIPTGPTMPFWMRVARAIGREIGTGGRRE